ncbi:HlyD family secretion protein [Thalassospira australica]|uniref:HlyD family secretion protein n=1 Tax=Thalassospira australica TaxID=1528106 RepID=UPI00051A79BA|nr:HlyD family efflux transporter periplasmic adaptor subunit [Thalassospira australica]
MKLKNHRPSTRLIREPRAMPKKRHLGRWIYVGILVMVGVWAFDVFFGHFFFLRGDGLVVARPYVVASEYIGTVRDITVRQGDRVKRGDVVAHLSSRQYDEQLARLRFELSNLSADRARISSQLAGTRELVSVARKRLKSAEAFREKLETGLKNGLSTGTALNTAYEREYSAREDLERITSDIVTLRAEVKALYQQIDQRYVLIHDIEESYDEGRLVAPESGIVTDVSAIESSVMRPGNPIMTIAAGKPYVLAYFENGSLYEINPGQEVLMYYGTRSLEGRVTSLLPVSEQLPEEFQRSFQPTGRAQIAEVEITTPENQPPLFAKLEIGGGLFSSIRRLFDWLLAT